jgi:PAS domain S-box-containing protein
MKGNLPKIYAKSDQIFSIFFLILFDIYLYIAFYFLFKKFLSLKSYQEKIKFGYFLIGASIPAFPGSVLLILGVARILPGQGWLIFPLFVLGYFFVGIGILKHGLFIDYREILEKIFRGLTELVIVTDREGWILLTNEMTLSKFGYSMEEVSEKKVEDILKGGREKWNEMLRKLGKLKTIFEERTSFFTKYGKEIPFLLSLSQVKEGIIFVGRDIKELLEYQKKLEQEVKKRTEELEEAKTVLEIKVAARTRELKELAERREEIVKERTKELREKLEELERFHKIAVSKELRMVELKKEIERLKKELEKSQKNKSKIKKEKEDCNAHR